MEPAVKAAWLEALRSGRYTQGGGRLRDGHRFCCLGVLCDLHAKATGGYWYGNLYDRLTMYPSAVVTSWAGTDKVEGTLSKMNDSGKSFDEIANYIEENL